jgi:hypothetical protein
MIMAQIHSIPLRKLLSRWSAAFIYKTLKIVPDNMNQSTDMLYIAWQALSKAPMYTFFIEGKVINQV